MPEHLSDFSSAPWAQKILTSPEYIQVPLVERRAPPPLDKFAKNRLIGQSLNNERCIRAWVVCRRVGGEGIGREEGVILLSVGDGLDSWDGMMHGGLISLLLDNLTVIMGNEIIHRLYPGSLGVTKEIKVDFRKAVRTPCLLLVRARAVGWVGEEDGVGLGEEIGKGDGKRRILRVRGTLEDGMGGVYAECESLIGRVGSGVGRGGGKEKGKREVKARL